MTGISLVGAAKRRRKARGRTRLVRSRPAVLTDPAKAEGQRAAPRAAAVLRLARTVAVAVAATYTGAVLGFAADAADHLDEEDVRKA